MLYEVITITWQKTGDWDQDTDARLRIIMEKQCLPLDVITSYSIHYTKLYDEYPLKTARMGEMLFLRGVVHFVLKERYKYIPFITEEMTSSDIRLLPNRDPEENDDMYIWEKILNDFTLAAQYLPATQADKGRPTLYSAKAYAVSTLLWMAYRQNETHQVVDVDAARLQQALTLCNDIINTSDRALTPDS